MAPPLAAVGPPARLWCSMLRSTGICRRFAQTRTAVRGWRLPQSLERTVACNRFDSRVLCSL